MEGLEREPQRAACLVIPQIRTFLMLKWILEGNCAPKPSSVLQICVSLKNRENLN